MEFPEVVNKLISQFTKLPGIGKKSAERFVFHLLKIEPKEADEMADAIKEVKRKIHRCSQCGNIDEVDPCQICRDEKRNKRVICVVEEIRDLFAIEATGHYRGLYHILMGAIAPLEGVGPDNLRIKELIKRVKSAKVDEVIIATSSSVEGDATSLYLHKLLKPLGVKVTRIAFGLPVGSGIEYADQSTLIKALEGRHSIS